MGGEKRPAFSMMDSVSGSPPHRRGKVFPKVPASSSLRITPAWAGKSLVNGGAFHVCWNHPRVGGEKHTEQRATAPGVESPPRGRGKETSPHLYCELSRITPAWAGKSLQSVFAWRGQRNHPRVGGEKTFFVVWDFALSESPPRGRGKDAAAGFAHPAGGITPAWAEKRSHHARFAGCPWNHPRVGGEKLTAYCFSPLHVRITPAWAGKSSAPP